MFFLIFLVLLVGGESEARNCDVDVREDCNAPGRFVFPANEEELATFCSTWIPYMECGIEHEEQCEKDEEELRLAKAILPIVEKFCNRDSEIYDDIVGSLPCVKNQMEPMGYCSMFAVGYRERKNSIPMTRLEGTDYGLKESDNEKCIDATMHFACMSVTIEHECGKNAKEAYNEIFQDLLQAHQVCKDEVVEDFPKVADALYEELRQEAEGGRY